MSSKWRRDEIQITASEWSVRWQTARGQRTCYKWLQWSTWCNYVSLLYICIIIIGCSSFSSPINVASDDTMSTILIASNDDSYRHATTVTPDTTSTISTHQQELRATSESPSSNHQQMSNEKSGRQSSLLSKPLTMASQTVAPPMTMMSSFMGDFKGGQTPNVENLSLGGYMELITLVKN